MCKLLSQMIFYRVNMKIEKQNQSIGTNNFVFIVVVEVLKITLSFHLHHNQSPSRQLTVIWVIFTSIFLLFHSFFLSSFLLFFSSSCRWLYLPFVFKKDISKCNSHNEMLRQPPNVIWHQHASAAWKTTRKSFQQHTNKQVHICMWRQCL